MLKIPCIVIIYYDFEIIQKALFCLTKLQDSLEIIVIENYSEYTDLKIKPFMQSLLATEHISKYYLFAENITNNAFEVVLDRELANIQSSKYILMTDGDLQTQNNDWLTEEIKILERHPEVFACAVTLSDCNLPIQNFPEAYDWWPKPIQDCDDYIESLTGFHLILVRTDEFKQYFKYQKNRGLYFLDGVMRQYCYQTIKKKWARTKHSQAIHLTWDRYQDMNNAYTQLKLAQPLEDIWKHNRYCSYQVFSKHASESYPASRQSLKTTFFRYFDSKLSQVKRYLKT
jgi:hypothetical protein